MLHRSKVLLLILTLCLLFGACTNTETATPPPPLPTQPTPEPAVKEIILATTSSTQDSGLLDVLIPDFEAKTGYLVKTVAVGTGNALAMGDAGDADVLLVHAPDAEQVIMDSGSGKDRLLIMHNDFVLLGPAYDPVGVQEGISAAEALTSIADSGATFVSRGDDSGTHKKELSLWQVAGITPQGDWYIESGQGMAATLKIASEKNAYTMSDRATYLASREGLDLMILVEGDEVLLNIYHMITINPEKWPKVNYDGAIAFAKYLTSPEVQQMIAEFGVDLYGQPLFFPDAG